MANTASRRVFEQADGTFIVNEYDIRGTFIREVAFATQAEADAFANDLTKDAPVAEAPKIEPEHETPVAPEAPVVNGESQPVEADQTPVAHEESAPVAPEDVPATPESTETNVPATPGEPEAGNDTTPAEELNQ